MRLAIAASKDHLVLPFPEKVELTRSIIERTLEVAKRPAVAFSGGYHSCIMLREVLKADPGILVYLVNLKLAMPDYDNIVRKFAEENSLNLWRVDTYSWADADEFMSRGIVFRGLQHVPYGRWEELRINQSCRRVRRRVEGHFLRAQGVDYVFTGVLAGDETSRMAWWLRDGYVKGRDRKQMGQGQYQVKPIAHWTEEDCNEECRRGKVPHPNFPYDYYGEQRQGEFGCFMCTVRIREEDGGNLGCLYRNDKELWNKVMYQHDGAAILRNIQDAFPKPWLARFIKEYLKGD